MPDDKPQLKLDRAARILIVDEEVYNRQLLEIVLGPEGFQVDSAVSGADALEKIARDPPDLVLLDIMMPGMDGYEVTARIKADPATRSIPVILITARDDQKARTLGLAAGAEEFLTKPVDRTELCLRVRNLLRLRAYSDYHQRHSRILEGDLVESERLYRSTFDAAPVGILHTGLDGSWLRANQRLGELLGYSTEELREAGPGLALAAEAPEETAAYRSMAAGTLDRYVIDEKPYRHRGGKPVWTRVNISVHREADGRARHFIHVLEDITQRRELAGQVLQTELDRTV